MNGLLWLTLAVGAEVVATSMLRAADGFTRLIPSVVVVIGYCVSFWALSQVVRMMPLGIAYAIWSGMGIVIVSAVAYFIYHQKLDLPAVIGMALIIAGVLVINLFSKSSVH